MNQPLRIVFMGTPEFAVPSLEALHAAGHQLPLVVTQPDRPRGRGRRPAPPAVKTAAQKLGLDVLQPETVRDDTLARRLKAQNPDLLVVIAFGHILPQTVLDIPVRGAVNLHASLLPRYRGPAPIQWAIINREVVTGVTTMFMDAGMDTGDILKTAATKILPDDTSSSLHDRLADIGADVLLVTLDGLSAGDLEPVAQNEDEASYAPMLKKGDGRIDWYRPAIDIEAHIRGVTPWPGAFTMIEGRRLKVFRALPLVDDHGTVPGTILDCSGSTLQVACGQGTLSLLEVQGESGKRMPVDAFLRGRCLLAGSKLG